jgi:hypothetical protein
VNEYGRDTASERNRLFSVEIVGVKGMVREHLEEMVGKEMDPDRDGMRWTALNGRSSFDMCECLFWCTEELAKQFFKLGHLLGPAGFDIANRKTAIQESQITRHPGLLSPPSLYHPVSSS